jgi:NAD(P)-dependent dehydrogenase (short-subunit alcohol dehydrogenase family)
VIRFDGEVAIVTGAGTGLGRAYSLLLASRGARVVVNDIGGAVDGRGASSTPADRVVAEIGTTGGEATASYDSVATGEGAARLVQCAVDRYGRVDILINNAGILRESPLGAMSLGDLEAVIQVHLLGSLYCTRAALPLMLAQNYGRIVLTSSATGLVGHADQSVYGAAKAAMIGIMNCVKLDCRAANVGINTVVPSATTRMSKGLVAEDLAQYMAPEHVAALVAYFASRPCTRSGDIVHAIGGHFARIALFRAAGVQFDPVEPITIEMIEGAYERIADLSGAQPYRGTLASLEPNLRAMGRL